MRLTLYRRTRDGRRVCARPTLLRWRRRWFYVRPDQEARFERRVFGVQAASFITMIVLMSVLGDRVFLDLGWLAVFVLVAAPPGVGHWITAGLEPAHLGESTLDPVDRTALNEEMARASGPVLLWLLFVAGLVIAALQLYVLLTDGLWWSWLGLAMFTLVSGAVAHQLLHLRAARSTSGGS